jgi:hypothetical protein
VIVTVTNAGNVLLPLKSGEIFLQQIRPFHPGYQRFVDGASKQDLREGNVKDLFKPDRMEIAWHELGYRKSRWANKEVQIEPGETEELQYDFLLLDDTIETIKVISYFKNETRKDREAGWTKTTVYDLKGHHEPKKDPKETNERSL